MPEPDDDTDLTPEERAEIDSFTLVPMDPDDIEVVFIPHRPRP